MDSLKAILFSQSRQCRPVWVRFTATACTADMKAVEMGQWRLYSSADMRTLNIDMVMRVQSSAWES